MSIFPSRVVLATDGSESATLAAQTAADICEKTGSELHVAHVLPVTKLYSNVDMTLVRGIDRYEEGEKEGRGLLEAQTGEVRRAGGTTAETHLRKGRPDQEIVALAEELDAGLIVIGSRGLGGVRRALMGSVSDSVVRHAHCPVLVIRGQEDTHADNRR